VDDVSITDYIHEYFALFNLTSDNRNVNLTMKNMLTSKYRNQPPDMGLAGMWGMWAGNWNAPKIF
jgi:hypothetical protein